jgi:Phosphodiester glycosidase
MPVLRRFDFPTKPLAIVIALAAAGAGGTLLVPRSGAQPAGIAVVHSTVRSPAGPVPVVSVRVSLADPRYRVVPVVAGQPVSGLDAPAAMNADFYNPTSDVPSGQLRIGGRLLVAGDPLEPSLGLGGGRAAIGRRLRGWPDVVSGKPRLVEGGRPVADLTADQVTPSQLHARVPRVAVALRGRQLWLVGVGRPGLTMREFQRLLVTMGARQALGFDSGPSADIAVGGRPLLGQPEQSVPVAIAIVAR